MPSQKDDQSDYTQNMDDHKLSPFETSIMRDQERVSALVNLNQRINYLARRKAEMQGPI
jgi:hypothetical protein